MNNCTIKYSIVMTVFNDENEILDLLENIKMQSYQPAEIIIVDGGSTDETCNVIKNYNPEIKLISGKRYNISQGLNVAIKNTSYQWVGIVATGNKYSNDFFEKLVIEAQSKNLNCGGIYGSIRGDESTGFGKLYSKYFMRENFGMPTNHGVLIHKNVFEQKGYFYERFVYAGEDAEFYRRAKKGGINFKYAKTAYVYWKTPLSYKEYFRQEKSYGIGHMQLYTNKILFSYYWKDMVYINFLFVLILLMTQKLLIGYLMLAICLIFNLIKIIKYDWNYCLSMNIKSFTRIICFVMNWKYLLSRNKIEKEYLINEVIK